MDFPVAPPDQQSIDTLAFIKAKRRLVREVISMIVAGAFVIALVATFYKILVS